MALWSALLLLGVIGSSTDKPANNEWNGALARNPVLPGYFADPCLRKIGDTYYLYVTPDGWDVGKGPFCIWTSKDFVHWKSHRSNWPTTNEKWAPSVIERGGKYYMYTQTPCMIWGAVSETPLGPWKSLAPQGQPIIPDQTPKGSIVLDGECFIDDDSKIYMWYSTWWTPTLAKMKSDMHTIDGDPIQYFESGRNPGYKAPFGTIQGCMEAPYMLKRKGIYYLMYSNNFCQDHTYQVEYSTAPTPWGPFTYGKNNPILSTNDDDTVDGPGHHSILEDGGKVYIVYHRHDNPHYPDGAHRQTAVDELHFLPDGSIEKVRPSHTGVGFLAPSTVRDTNLVVGASARASSSAGRFFEAQNVADENNGTLWKAKEYKYPQSVTLDLSKVQGIARVETEFQFAQIGYQYVLETSTDGNKWLLYADRKTNREWGPMTDRRQTKARYVRLTMLSDDAPQRPIKEIAIWNIKVYDGIDKPNRAPRVSAGPNAIVSNGNLTRLLQGTVDDDGLPYGPVKVQWSVVSGPEKVIFEHADRLATEATFSKSGRYVLKLTADDGKLKSSQTVVYSVVPQEPSLVHLTFEESYGNLAKDRTTSGNDGAIKIGAKRTIGVIGGAVKLSANEWIDVPTLKRSGDFTFAAWVNLHELRPNACLARFGTGLSLRVSESGEVGVYDGGQAIAKSLAVFGKEMLGQWVHLAVSANVKNRTVFFFRNGIPCGQAQTDARLLPTESLRIGGDGFVGEFDELHIYGHALDGKAAGAFARAPIFSIKDMLSLPAGSRVRVLSKTAAYAPVDLKTNERSTPFFYIADETGGIKVDDSGFGSAQVSTGLRYTFDGLVKADSTGEKTVVPISELSVGAVSSLEPREGGTTPGSFTRIRGIAKNIKAGSFEIALANETVKVSIAKGVAVRKFAEGNEVEVTGVIGTGKVLLLAELIRLNPPSDGLLVRYNFDSDASGTVIDDSGNGCNARMVGEAKLAVGKQGQALDLNGRDAYLQMPELGMHRSMTMSTWIKVNSLHPIDWAMSIFHRPTWEGGDPHAQVMNGSGCIRLAVNGNTPELIDSRFSFKQHFGEWVHVAITYDAKSRKSAIIVNGKMDSEVQYGVARPLNLDSLKLGCWGPEPRFLHGSVDDFRIYDRVLSQDEIAKIYTSQL